MATVGEVLAWRPALLDAMAAELVANRRGLVDLGGDVDAGRPPSSWIGDDADAAARTHRALRCRLNDLVAEVAAVARALACGGRAAASARRAVDDAVAEARSHGFHVDMVSGVVLDPAVPDPDPALADDRVRHREELVQRIAEGLRAADHADSELAQTLNLVASSLVDGGNASLAEAVAAGNEAARREVLPMPILGTPGEVFGWWRGLPAAERRRLIADRPRLIGNTDGIPLAARDQANRRYLPLAEKELLDDWRRSTGLNSFQRMLDQSVQSPGVLRDKLRDLATISRVISAPGTTLLSLGIDGRRHVTTDIGVGRVDKAKHVATLVSGVNAHPSRNLGTKVEEARDLLDLAAEISEQAGDEVGPSTHAVIVSMGYEAPQLQIAELRQMLTDDIARESGPGCADLLNGLDVTRSEDPHLTVAGHSYGSLVASHALQEGTGVDDFVALGSPGTGVDDVDDLRVPDGHVHNLEAEGDLVADTGWFGRDLTQLDGVRQLDTAGHDDLGLTKVTGHTSYYTSGSTSQHNVAAVVSGHPEELIDDTRGPDFSDDLREDIHRVDQWVDDRLDHLEDTGNALKEEAGNLLKGGLKHIGLG